jgi:glycosyltransferase involved in cell wall biosynthesis
VSRPRIAFISTMRGMPWGGSEELWGRTALRLLREREVDVFAHVNWHRETAPVLAEIVEAGGVVERNEPKRFYLRALHRLLHGPPRPFLERVQPDLVVISQGAHYDGAAWMIECADRRLRYASIVQCFVEGHSFADSHAEPLRRGYDEAVVSYFVSEANRDFTRRLIASPIERSRIIRNPYNVANDAAPAWPEPTDGVFRLACVARLETTVKGHDILFEVLSDPKWKERPLAVTLYGAGPNEQTLRRLKDLYRLDNVTFAGTTRDIESIWASHHGMILTSRWEGLPLAVVEAMLCGRICIVTDVAGNAELLTDNRTGFVAAAPKTELVDEALERAWQRRTEWREMGQEAARQVRQQVPQDPVEVFADEVMSLLAK